MPWLRQNPAREKTALGSGRTSPLRVRPRREEGGPTFPTFLFVASACAIANPIKCDGPQWHARKCSVKMVV